MTILIGLLAGLGAATVVFVLALVVTLIVCVLRGNNLGPWG